MDFDVVLDQSRGHFDTEGLDEDRMEDTPFLIPSGADEIRGCGIVASKLPKSVIEMGF